MSTSKQLQREHTIASSSLVPTYPALRPSRSLVSRPTPSSEQVHPVTQAQLEHAARFGHSFERISLFPPERKNNTGLPDTLKAGIENLSGMSMGDVKVHYNSSQPAQVHALAYTQGAHIHVGPGQQKHLAHEAWHVVQQKQGRVQPTLQAYGVVMNDNQGLEIEADVMGGRAYRASVRSFQREETSGIGSAVKRSSLTNSRANSSQQAPIQRVFTGVDDDDLNAIYNALTQISPGNVKSFEELRDFREEYFDINEWLSQVGINKSLQELIEAGSKGVGSKRVEGEASRGLGLAPLSDPALAKQYEFLLQSSTFQQISKRATGQGPITLRDSSKVSLDVERNQTSYTRAYEAISVPSLGPGGAQRTEKDVRGRLLFELLNAANREQIEQKEALFKDKDIDPYIKAGYALATEWYEWVNTVEHYYLTYLINEELNKMAVTSRQVYVQTYPQVLGDQPQAHTYRFSEYLAFEIGQDHTSLYDPAAKDADWKGKEIVGVVESQNPPSLVITPQQLVVWQQSAGQTKIVSGNPFLSLQIINEAKREAKRRADVRQTLKTETGADLSKLFGDRITEELVKELTDKNDLQTLKDIISSPYYPLEKWDQEAWTLFLDWNAKPDHQKVVV